MTNPPSVTPIGVPRVERRDAPRIDIAEQVLIDLGIDQAIITSIFDDRRVSAEELADATHNGALAAMIDENGDGRLTNRELREFSDTAHEYARTYHIAESRAFEIY